MTKKKIIAIVSIIVSVILLIILSISIWNANLKKADYSEGILKFDDKTYEEISYKDIEPYKETYKIVCKTKDGIWTIYEIEQYPDYEYVVARAGWEACVLKRVN